MLPRCTCHLRSLMVCNVTTLNKHALCWMTTYEDALCTTDNGRQVVVVEVDGPTHFSNQARLLDGASCLKHALLRHAGFVVVLVHYMDWDACKNKVAREGLLRQLLLNAVP